jgi:hypothetical protein
MSLRRFVPKWGSLERTEKLHEEEHHALCSSPNMIRVITSRRMEIVRNTAGWEDKMNAYNFMRRNLKEI